MPESSGAPPAPADGGVKGGGTGGKAKEIMFRKLGPLPVIAWVAIGAVAVLILKGAGIIKLPGGSGGGLLTVGPGTGGAGSGGSAKPGGSPSGGGTGGIGAPGGQAPISGPAGGAPPPATAKPTTTAPRPAGPITVDTSNLPVITQPRASAPITTPTVVRELPMTSTAPNPEITHSIPAGPISWAPGYGPMGPTVGPASLEPGGAGAGYKGASYVPFSPSDPFSIAPPEPPPATTWPTVGPASTTPGGQESPGVPAVIGPASTTPGGAGAGYKGGMAPEPTVDNTPPAGDGGGGGGGRLS